MKKQIKKLLAMIVILCFAIVYMPVNASAGILKILNYELATIAASATAGNASSGNASSGNASSGNASSGNASSGNASTDDTNKDDTPADDTNKDDTSADDTNKDDTSADDTNKDDTSADDTNKDDTSADDTNKDDTSADDTNKDDTDNGDADEEESKVDSEDVADQIKDNEDKNVEIKNTEAITLDKNVFEEMKESNKNLVFNVVDKDNNLDYSWTFASGAIKDANLSVDLKMDKAEKNDKVDKHVSSEDVLYMNFAHHGKLPGNATLNVNVNGKFKDGDNVYLYYYDEEADKVLKVGNNALKIKDGCVEFTISHCSTYFITDELLNVERDLTSPENADYNVTEGVAGNGNQGDNFNMNILLYLLAACFVSLTAFVVASNKGVKAVRQ